MDILQTRGRRRGNVENRRETVGEKRHVRPRDTDNPVRRGAGPHDSTAPDDNDRRAPAVGVSRDRRPSHVRAPVRQAGAAAQGPRRRLGVHAVDRQDRDKDGVGRDPRSVRASDRRREVREPSLGFGLRRRRRPAVDRAGPMRTGPVFSREPAPPTRWNRSPKTRDRANRVGRTQVRGHQ